MENICYGWSVSDWVVQVCGNNITAWQAVLVLVLLIVLIVLGLAVIGAGIQVILALNKYEKDLRKR